MKYHKISDIKIANLDFFFNLPYSHMAFLGINAERGLIKNPP